MKKRHLSSRSSSSESDEELRVLRRLEAERRLLKDQKKKQKEQLKASETPGEKRARRLREKQDKERKCRERMGWDNVYQCYTNQDNPFGDSALTDTFVWTKKLVKEGIKALPRDELKAINRQKQLENMIELTKVQQRRLKREAKIEASAAVAASRSDAWTRREDAFQIQQARLRSQIRIRDGRAKPIDCLVNYVSSEECVDALEIHEPSAWLSGLQSQDLEDLLEDIKVYKELESNANQAWWEDVQTVVLDELDKLRRLAAPAARRHAVHRAVADDVTQIFKDKTVAQLSALQTQLQQASRGADGAYWGSVRAQLRAHISRARLRERHLQLQRARAGQRGADTQQAGQRGADKQQTELRGADTQLTEEPHRSQSEVVRAAAPAPTLGSGERERAARYRPTRMLDHMEPATWSVRAGAEHALPGGSRRRKPRYFNRVLTAVEWNQYSRAHYDAQRPPPARVRGYQFNVLYPDLVDKRATPTFSLKACPENPDLAVVRFHAGPPYADIAFKIVNREWEHSPRRGFRCHFHNNIFRLWFQFKRYRYHR
ncbi:hypothetical protein PYW08_005926 [Mythimna loreyi]|uniref:Uncharacterized protein n=1 Tax=Mythimna loreyi TaxID=667449 RepID=A0ACC2QHW4_9NEOP|nr:hypothetical protein PYW08_005926 [Mythimna loreyi]